MKPKKKKNNLRLINVIADWSRSLKWDRHVALALLLSYLIAYGIIALATLRGSLLAGPPTPELGAVAGEDIVVDRDIFYVDEEATVLKRDARVKLVPPVFAQNDDIGRESVEAYDRFREVFAENLQEEESEDVLLTKIQYEFPRLIGKLRKDELLLLTAHNSPGEVFDTSRVILSELMEEGVTNLEDLKDQDSAVLTSGKISVWRGRAEKEEIPLDQAISVSKLPDRVEQSLASFGLDEVSNSLVSLLVGIFVEENTFYDKEQTEEARRKASLAVEDVVRKLARGQVIVRKGDIITAENLVEIKAVGESTITININNLSGTAFFLGILYALSFFLLQKRFSDGFLRAQIYLLVGTGLFYLVAAAFIAQIPWASEWLPRAVLIPTSAIAILITVVISAKAGIGITVILSLLLLLIFRLDVLSFLFALLSGVAGCAVALRAEKRIDLINAGLYLSLMSILILVVLGFLKNFQLSKSLPALGWGFANGFSSGILSLGFLPILEHMMNAPTRFRLMELSDLNAPIFKKMLSLAPGTYNHSIAVANLSESACTAIGANALLARVGAYYHDIGKIEQAKYFIENQRERNKHDDLKPSLSVAVIKSHVKVGIEKARELGLPKKVTDIIAQHHGKGVISYFYQRALSTEKNKKVSSGDFSYTGSWPKTKEAAVVMLADTVEAASRTLSKPSVAKLEKFVWSVIMDKFTEGELGSSNLALKDLEVIKKSFVHILAGLFHSRIEYPKKKEMAQ
jgi:putative nucleotidyltransferase with HDIG domain